MSASPTHAPPPDLAAVDDLCRLVVVAQRLGCTVQLAGASDELRALLDLAGVGEVIGENQPVITRDETDLR